MTPTDRQQCRDLALEKRILASRMKDPLAQATLIRLAKHYEELAKQPEGSIRAMSEWLRLKPAFPDAQSLPANSQHLAHKHYRGLAVDAFKGSTTAAECAEREQRQ